MIRVDTSIVLILLVGHAGSVGASGSTAAGHLGLASGAAEGGLSLPTLPVLKLDLKSGCQREIGSSFVNLTLDCGRLRRIFAAI